RPRHRCHMAWRRRRGLDAPRVSDKARHGDDVGATDSIATRGIAAAQSREVESSPPTLAA
ncbi:hypothetical protein, partial [Sphingomonas sp.]|uniref:hypothetical protein n=1 Tax=Sphingomonas sp. TaxID=28214 RepID=UPI0025EA30A3